MKEFNICIRCQNLKYLDSVKHTICLDCEFRNHFKPFVSFEETIKRINNEQKKENKK